MSEKNLQSQWPKKGFTGPAPRMDTSFAAPAARDNYVAPPAKVRHDAADGTGHRGVKLDKTLGDCRTGYEGSPRLGHDNTLTTPNTGRR
jgi:hypothetical protein